MDDRENVLLDSVGALNDSSTGRFTSVRASLRRELWIPFLVWLILVAIPLIPLFLSSYWLIGENGLHGVQIGITDEVYIHGSELKCKDDQPTRECTLIINGSLLEISAASREQWRRCEIRYEGETFGCRLAKVTGESQSYPPEAQNGIRISDKQLTQLILADQASWRNWRSAFLGVGLEETILSRVFGWATISLFIAFFITPRFLKTAPLQLMSRQTKVLFSLIKIVALVIALPVMYYILLYILIGFQFVL